MTLALLFGPELDGTARAADKDAGAQVPSYYGGGSARGSKLVEQARTQDMHRNLAGKIKLSDGVARDIAKANEVVANPQTGEVRAVTAVEKTPDGWLRLDVQRGKDGAEIVLVSRDTGQNGEPFTYKVPGLIAAGGQSGETAGKIGRASGVTTQAGGDGKIVGRGQQQQTTESARGPREIGGPGDTGAAEAPPARGDLLSAAPAAETRKGYRPPIARQGMFAGGAPPGPGPGPGPPPGPGGGPGPGPGPGPGAGPGAGPGSGPGAGPGAGSEPAPSPSPGPRPGGCGGGRPPDAGGSGSDHPGEHPTEDHGGHQAAQHDGADAQRLDSLGRARQMLDGKQGAVQAGGRQRHGQDDEHEQEDEANAERLASLQRSQQMLQGGQGPVQSGGRRSERDRHGEHGDSAENRANVARVESQNRAQIAIQGQQPVGPMRGGRRSEPEPDATPALRDQIGRLSQAVAQAADVTEAEQAAAAGQCPPALANACGPAADKAADNAQEAIDEAAEKDQGDAEKDLDKTDDDLKKKEDRAKREKDKRKKETRRQRLEREQRERAERLQDEADKLKERGDKLTDERDRLEKEERDLRQREQDARRNDPNCRSAECRNIQEQRRANSRATTDLARQEGRFQADQAKFQGQVQSWQRDQAELDKMSQGDPVYETRRAQADAHKRVGDAQSELDRLKAEQQELREKGGSGSREDRAYDRAISGMEGQLDALKGQAQAADQLALKAQFYDNGMGDQWKDFEKAQRSANAFNAAADAGARVNELQGRYEEAQDSLASARASGNFSPEHLAEMEADVANLKEQLGSALDRQKTAMGDLNSATKAQFGAPQPFSNATAAKLSGAVSGFGSELAERQRLAQMTDAELAAEQGMLSEARGRVAAAKQSLAGGGAPDPGGAYTNKYNDLKQQQQKLQGQIDNFNPGNNPGAADAYRGLQDQLGKVEAELGKLGPIAEANGAFERVAQHQDYVASLTAGFPTSAPGQIDKAAFRDQVADVAQGQLGLVQGNGALAAANKAVANAEAKGDKPAADAARSQVRAATDQVQKATADLSANGIDVATKPGGGFTAKPENYGAATTWQAAAQGVDSYVNAANKAPAKPNPPMQQPSKAAAPAEPPAPPPDKPADQPAKAEGKTAERSAGGVGKAETVTTGEPPGGPAAELTRTSRLVDEQASAMRPPPVNPSAAPAKPTVEQLRQQSEEARRQATEARRDADAAQREADKAKEQAERAKQEAEQRRDTADRNTGTQERQAGAYTELAESAIDQGDKFRQQATELENRAAALREQAARYDALAAKPGTEKGLADGARQAAQANREQAGLLDDQAEDRREDAAREDKLADERTSQSNRLQGEADSLKERAEKAEEKAEQAEADAAERQAEADRLAAQADVQQSVANSQTQVAKQAQLEALNTFIATPPPGFDWESMTQPEQSEWLSKNVPDWDKLSPNDRMDMLRRMEFSDQRADYEDAKTRKEEFDASPQGQRTTTDELRRRTDALKAKEEELKKLKEAEGGAGYTVASRVVDSAVTTQREQRIKQLEQEIADDSFRLRNDINVRMTAENEFNSAVMDANRAFWQVDAKARAEEVQSRVATLANAKVQVDLARSTQEARTAALDQREAELKRSIASGQNVSEAREELSKLNEARKQWEANDQRNVDAAERIYRDAQHDVALQSGKDGLGEIAFEEDLDARVNQFIKDNPGPRAQAIDSQTAAVRAGVDALDLGQEQVSVTQSIARSVVGAYDTVTGTVSDTAVSISAGAGFVYGTGKGIVNGAIGLLDLANGLQDFALETVETGLTGQSALFGTESLDAARSLSGQSPVDLAVKLAVGLGEKVSTGLDQVAMARETGSLSDAFVGASKPGEVVGEIFIDPIAAVGTVGKLATIVRGLGAVDDVARVGGIASDVARAGDLASDAARLAGKVDNVAGAAGTSARFAGEGGAAARAGNTLPPASSGSSVSGGTEVIAGRADDAGRLKPVLDAPGSGPGPHGTQRVPAEGVDFGGKKPKLGDVVDMAPGDSSPSLPPPSKPAIDYSATAPGSLSKDLTPAQIDRLFEPGRNLSSAEIIQKADLIRAKRVPLSAAQGDPDLLRALDETFGIKANRAEVTPGGTIVEPVPVNMAGGPRAPPPPSGTTPLSTPDLPAAAAGGGGIPPTRPPSAAAAAGGASSGPPTSKLSTPDVPGSRPASIPPTNAPRGSSPSSSPASSANEPLLAGDRSIPPTNAPRGSGPSSSPASSANEPLLAGAADRSIPPTNAPRGSGPSSSPASSANEPLLAGAADRSIPATNAPGARPPSGSSGLATNEPLLASRAAEQPPASIGSSQKTPTQPPPRGAAPPPDSPSSFNPIDSGGKPPSPSSSGDFVIPLASSDLAPAGQVIPFRGPSPAAGPSVGATAKIQPGSIVLETPGGAARVLQLGPQKGKGSFTTTFGNAGAGGGVVKLTKAGSSPYAAALDKAGEAGIASLPKHVQDTVVSTPRTLEDIPIRAANDNAYAGGAVRIVEDAGVPTYWQAQKNSLMSKAEAESFVKAELAINDNGRVWLDNKSDNFGFDPAKNNKVIIHDPGGVVPIKGSSAAEISARAREFQAAVSYPSTDWVNRFTAAETKANQAYADLHKVKKSGTATQAQIDAAQRAYDQANDAYKSVPFEYKNALMRKYGGWIDTGELKVPLDEIKFNPVNGFRQRQAGAILGNQVGAEVMERIWDSLPPPAYLPGQRP
ncbi:MAG: hypothetical protein AB7O49_19760 [Sphingomonadales bacterium]